MISQENYHKTIEMKYIVFPKKVHKMAVHVVRIELRNSRTLSENHTTRPTSQCIVTILLFLACYQVGQGLSTHILGTKTKE